MSYTWVKSEKTTALSSVSKLLENNTYFEQDGYFYYIENDSEIQRTIDENDVNGLTELSITGDLYCNIFQENEDVVINKITEQEYSDLQTQPPSWP